MEESLQTKRSLIALFFFFLSNCLFAQNELGKTFSEKVKINGLNRTYVMHIPNNLPIKAPLVFVLHGYGGQANPANYEMDEVSDKNNFAVCYPQGEKDPKGENAWNVGYPFQKGWELDDVSFICKLSKHLHMKYHLSSKNIFCTGLSNGGEMCYLLAYKRPDVFAAIAPVAGLTMGWIYKSMDAPGMVPLFEIHGTKDVTSCWNGDLGNKGGWGIYIPVPIAVNYWVVKNRCTEEKADTLEIKNKTNDHYVITHKYINGNNGNEVWLYEIINGGHSWGTQDLNTSEEIWKFFSKFLK